MAEQSEFIQAARAAFAKAAADLRAAELAEWASKPLVTVNDIAASTPLRDEAPPADFATLCADVRAIRRLLEEQGQAVRLVSRVVGAA